jgi:hypothetical protein
VHKRSLCGHHYDMAVKRQSECANPASAHVTVHATSRCKILSVHCQVERALPDVRRPSFGYHSTSSSKMVWKTQPDSAGVSRLCPEKSVIFDSAQALPRYVIFFTD